MISKHKDGEWEKLEKILLTIVGGTLGATVTFLTGKEAIFSHYHVLGISWIFLSVSLIALFCSYGFSEILDLKMLKKLENGPEFVSEESWIEMVNCWPKKSAEFSNYIALLFAIGGMGTLALFGFLNIP